MKCPVCKKNISETALKCPYCKTRTGLMCSHCGTVNPVDNFVCKNCGNELLKVCSNCNSVNFPGASKCRKCGSPFIKAHAPENNNLDIIKYSPKLYTMEQAVDLLMDGINSTDKKIFSITGEKGIGKTTVLNAVIKNLENKNYQWCIGKCTQLTQLTPGGVVQDIFLSLFKLPNFCTNSEEFKNDAIEFFSKEFKFLSLDEVNDFLNFIYNYKIGNYEDIIINKKHTYKILNKIFDAFTATGKFIYVVDNFNFIDGFSAEFFSNFMHKDKNWKNLKFIAIYDDYKPISGFFAFDNKNINSYLDINLAPMSMQDMETKVLWDKTNYLSSREKDVIFQKSSGNIAFIEQAMSYALDCQINEKAFLLPEDFSELIKIRLETLKKTNNECYRMLCGASVLGDKLNVNLIKEIFGYEDSQFKDILSYLVQSNFIRPRDEIYYEFNNLLLWENILKNITKDSSFDDINVKIGKAISVFNLNTNPTMAMIAHNLKENRMAFDIWTKTSRLSAYIGDINLYVIAQKQCLALLNEFNETETVNIRYNISEKLGKLLTEYDPEEALEYLPDAISYAKENENEVKEIELLGYLANCCQKTGNYFGNVECVDNVLKKLPEGQSLERSMLLTAKLSALIDIGNCGEVINLIDNDILPVLNANLAKPKLSKLFPMGILFDTWLKVYLILATALSLQGNDRVFEVLKNLFSIIEKHKINDKLLICKAKVVLAYANTMRGNYRISEGILEEINGNSSMDNNAVSRWNLVSIINKLMLKNYDGLREELFEGVTFANNTGDNFTKNMLKALLGKIFKDENMAKRALDIYNEQVTYFAKEKMALGALLCWYLIADASIVTENSRSAIDVAERALEIAQNPNIDNKFFVVLLKTVLASAYTNIADFATAKMHLETAVAIAKKYNMYDMLSRLYLQFGKYYQEIGGFESQSQGEYLKGSALMYEKSMELAVRETNNAFVKNVVNHQKELLNDFCVKHGFKL
ncbi:hypothetical protein J6G99_04925 [bacterium]|nr:hypothetical protein [bacterium]